MSLNCAEIDVVLEELSLSGSFIQNIVQPSFDTIAFYTYRGGGTGHEAVSRVVLVCLAPGACRLHETWRKVPRTEKPLRFMEFLRSRVKGSRIAAAVQCGSDRIIKITLERADERLFMYIRLWSGAANIIVTDESGVIQDVFYRRPKRNELTGERWELPEARSGEQTAGSAAGSAQVFVPRDIPGEGSFNERLDRWYAEHAQTLSCEALVEEARRRFDTRRSKLEHALVRLDKKRTAFLEADLWRKQGDLLTANLWAIKPGMEAIELEDYESGNRIIRIPLDPRLKPAENAARWYDKYRKAVSGLADLEDDIASTRRTLETLAAELAALEAENNPLVIQQMLRKQNRPKQQIKKKYPGLTFRKDGWIMLVGRTAVENDEILRRHVRGSDWWLHTRDWPGGYVFVKYRSGKTIPLDILLDAGNLAVFYSKGRKARTADLYYTQVKHLRRAKNAPKGTVLPSNERNLSITLDESRLKVLETCRDEE